MTMVEEIVRDCGSIDMTADYSKQLFSMYATCKHNGQLMLQEVAIPIF
jgi:hypothetical protein